MRNAFADEIANLADRDERVVLLSGDIGNRLFDRFKDKHPTRFFNVGVAEANMISMAAGLAMGGLRPVTYTIASFTTYRCMEQIRVDLCYQNLPVVVVGVGAGLAYAANGPTHHTGEDVAMLRALPNMTVVCPADAWEGRAALRELLKRPGPSYLRLGKKGEPAVHTRVPELTVGKAIVIRPGSKVALLSTGTIMPEVLAVADRLRGREVDAEVTSIHTVKPLDETYLRDAFRRFDLVATVEEHSRIGGLGGAVAEWLSDHPWPRARLLRLGMDDHFLHEAGEQEHARECFGLDAEGIFRAVSNRLDAS